MIQPAWRGDLHAYLGGIIRTADGIAESIGGVSDHVHLLIGLRATHRLADVIRELKAVSSGWVHNEIGMRGFAWQEGYGAFTVALPNGSGRQLNIQQQAEGTIAAQRWRPYRLRDCRCLSWHATVLYRKYHVSRARCRCELLRSQPCVDICCTPFNPDAARPCAFISLVIAVWSTKAAISRSAFSLADRWFHHRLKFRDHVRAASRLSDYLN